MAHTELVLRSAAELAAWSVAGAGVALLLLAMAAELLRRAHIGAALVALSDRLLPTPSRRVAVALLTLLSAATALALPPGAGADDRVRSWLVDDADRATTMTTTTTTTTGSRLTATPPTTPATTSTTTTSPTSPRAPEATGAIAPSAPVAPPRPTAVLRAVPPASIATPVAPSPVSATPVAPSPVSATPVGPGYPVVPGDCLWSIATRILGRDASSRAIDRGWRAIYAANRGAIGSDPNLIHPGLVLTLPPLDPTP
jgi:LysM repeat protein